MTPEERANGLAAAIERDGVPTDKQGYRLLRMAIAEEICAAVASERALCMADVCSRCSKGEPILDRNECKVLGHSSASPCHLFAGTGMHVTCGAAAIRARTP